MQFGMFAMMSLVGNSHRAFAYFTYLPETIGAGGMAGLGGGAGGCGCKGEGDANVPFCFGSSRYGAKAHVEPASARGCVMSCWRWREWYLLQETPGSPYGVRRSHAGLS